MISGRIVIIIMLLLGAGLIGGYDLVRRAASPEPALEIEDRGSERGIFDRVYEFRGERYCVREGELDPRSIGTVIVARLTSSEGESPAITRDRDGTVDSVHFLDQDDSGPTIVVVTRSVGTGSFAEGTLYRLRGQEFEAAPLERLPEELRKRSLGHDEYERQGAFLYRKIRLEPRKTGGEPVTMKLFYDFKNQRWVTSD